MFKRTFKRAFFAAAVAAALPLTGCGERNEELSTSLTSGSSEDEAIVNVKSSNEEETSEGRVIEVVEASPSALVGLRHFDVYQNYRAMFNESGSSGSSGGDGDRRSGGGVRTQNDKDVAESVLSIAGQAFSTCSLRALIMGD